VVATIASFLAPGLTYCVAQDRPELIAEVPLEIAATRNIAFDASGDVWLATRDTLYKVQDGRPEVVDEVPQRYDRIALAPAGGLYARLHAISDGTYAIELVEIPKKPIAKLRLPDSSVGFGGIYLGGAGQLVVTAKALDNAEGLGGRFQYVFWSSKGEYLSEATLDGPRTVVVDSAGTALVLLGREDAIAFSKDGKRLWKLDGAYRRAALAAGGTVALLNPQQPDAIQKVDVFRDGAVTAVDMRSPVFDLAIAADGSIAAVATGGEISLISPQRCAPSSCEAETVPPIRSDGTFFITEMRFLNRTALALGMIERVGDQEPHRFPAGSAVVWSTLLNAIVYSRRIELEQPATWAPMLDVTYGIGSFAAHTPHRALLVRLKF
jgi:hypothetical protein